MIKTESIKIVKEGELSFFLNYVSLLIFFFFFIPFSTILLSSLLLLLIFIVLPPPPLPPHFCCFPSKRPKRPKSGLKGQTQMWWPDFGLFDSEDDYRTGCRNVSHCQQQQSYSGFTKCSGCKTHPHCAFLPCVCHCRKKRHARSKTFGFTYIKLRFLVIFMLWACPFVIFNGFSASTNTMVQPLIAPMHPLLTTSQMNNHYLQSLPNCNI